MLDCDIKAVYSPKDVILTAINECYNRETGAASQLIANLGVQGEDGRGDGEVEVYDLLDDSSLRPPSSVLNLIISEAVRQGASDIRFRALRR